jgi:hypothetical protein
MTDTNWPEHWLTDPGMNTLTDAAFRVFANGLMWSVTHGTDGELPRSALRWLHPDENALSAAVAELVAVGKWAEDSDGYLIANFLRHQTSAAVIEAARLLADRAGARPRDRPPDAGRGRRDRAQLGSGPGRLAAAGGRRGRDRRLVPVARPRGRAHRGGRMITADDTVRIARALADSLRSAGVWLTDRQVELLQLGLALRLLPLLGMDEESRQLATGRAVLVRGPDGTVRLWTGEEES